MVDRCGDILKNLSISLNLLYKMYFVYLFVILLGICDLGMSDSFDDEEKVTSCPQVIPRSSWGGQQLKSVSPTNGPLSYVIIEHTATPKCIKIAQCVLALGAIQEYHINSLGWSDIGYSFMIGGDGKVYEGRGWEVVSGGISRWHTVSFSIAFSGNYDVNKPNQTMLDTARNLIDCGKAEGLLTDYLKIIGLRQVTDTESPGIKLFAEIQKWPEWMSGSNNK